MFTIRTYTTWGMKDIIRTYLSMGYTKVSETRTDPDTMIACDFKENENDD